MGVRPGEEEMVQLAALCARIGAASPLLTPRMAAPADSRGACLRLAPLKDVPGRVAGDDAAFETQLCRLQAARQLLQPASLRSLLAACDRPTVEAVEEGDGQREAIEEGDWQRGGEAGDALGGSGGSGAHRATLVACPDGVCASCGTMLAALPLTAVQRRQMCDELLSVAAAQGDAARQDLLHFGEWVVQQGFTHIVDGPNVGYRNQNFHGGSFSFAQVDCA